MLGLGSSSSGPPSRSSRASSDVEASDPALALSAWSLPYSALTPMDKTR